MPATLSSMRCEVQPFVRATASSSAGSRRDIRVVSNSIFLLLEGGAWVGKEDVPQGIPTVLLARYGGRGRGGLRFIRIFEAHDDDNNRNIKIYINIYCIPNTHM